MAIHNKKHLRIKAAQKRITCEQFADIQNSLGLSNEQTALILGLSLNLVEAFRIKARQKDICGAPASASILLLKFLAQQSPKAFNRVVADFHEWTGTF